MTERQSERQAEARRRQRKIAEQRERPRRGQSRVVKAPYGLDYHGRLYFGFSWGRYDPTKGLVFSPGLAAEAAGDTNEHSDTPGKTGGGERGDHAGSRRGRGVVRARMFYPLSHRPQPT